MTIDFYHAEEWCSPQWVVMKNGYTFICNTLAGNDEQNARDIAEALNMLARRRAEESPPVAVPGV